MTVRATPYPPPGHPVRIPMELWNLALETVRTYSRLGAEGGRRGSGTVVYFGGAPMTGGMIVTTLYRLGHAPQGDRGIA